MEIPTRALILKKGTAEQIKNIVFPLGEIIFDTTNMRIIVGDGVTKGGADAVLAASIFHFGEYTIEEAKRFMAAQGIPVRL